MNSPSVSHLAANVTDVVGDAVTSGRSLVHDVAQHVPDVTDSVSKIAHTSADTVSDVVHDLPGQVGRAISTVAAMAPFLHQAPARHRRRWLVPAAIVGVIAAFAVWRWMQHRQHDALDPAGTDSDVAYARSTPVERASA